MNVRLWGSKGVFDGSREREYDWCIFGIYGELFVGTLEGM